MSITPRNITLPLSMAFLFDTGINNGVYHSMITDAEQALNVPPHSRVPDNGITEQQLITKVEQSEGVVQNSCLVFAAHAIKSYLTGSLSRVRRFLLSPSCHKSFAQGSCRVLALRRRARGG